MDENKEIDLLLIGKTGNGKSATGNSILNRRAFKRSGSTSSVTRAIKEDYSKYKGLTIKVVDSPGVGETRLQTEAAVKMVTKALKQAIITNPRGYNAFLIVLKFGNRFTGEEQETIQFLKKIFGPSFVRDFCILVMCAGDEFYREFYDQNMTFESWCEKQEGAMEELLKECGHRIVLFDNNLIDSKLKEEQLDKLINMIRHLSAGGKRYTDEHFEEARATRDRIMVEAKECIIQEETKKETGLIIQKLEYVQNSKDDKGNRKILQKLKTRTDTFLAKLVVDDKGTGVLHDLVDSVKSIKTTIENEIAFNQRLVKEREENKRREEDMKRRHEEDMKKLNQRYERLLLEKKLEEKEEFEEEKKESQKRQQQEERERREMEEKRIKEEKEERKRLIKEKEEAESKYRQATDTSYQNFVSKTVDWVAAPVKGVSNWACSWFK